MKTVADASASCRVKVSTYVCTSGSASTRSTCRAPRRPSSAASATSERETVANADSAATNTAATARHASAAAKRAAIATSVLRGLRDACAARLARREVGEQESALEAEHLRLLRVVPVVVAHEVEEAVGYEQQDLVQRAVPRRPGLLRRDLGAHDGTPLTSPSRMPSSSCKEEQE